MPMLWYKMGVQIIAGVTSYAKVWETGILVFKQRRISLRYKIKQIKSTKTNENKQRFPGQFARSPLRISILYLPII